MRPGKLLIASCLLFLVAGCGAQHYEEHAGQELQEDLAASIDASSQVGAQRSLQQTLDRESGLIWFTGASAGLRKGHMQAC